VTVLLCIKKYLTYCVHDVSNLASTTQHLPVRAYACDI